MADIPPLLPMPDELLSSNQLKHAADWAEAGGETTNLAKRARQNASIQNYTEALQRERAAQQQHLIQTNRVAQDLHFKNEKLEMDQREAAAALSERQQRMNFAKEMHPIALATKEAATRASLANEALTIQNTRLKADREAKAAEDSLGFTSAIHAAIPKLGTPDYERAVVEARMNFPAVNKDIFADAWKTTNSPRDPEQLVEEIRKAKAALPDASVTGSQKGGISITAGKDTDPVELRHDRDYYSSKLERAKDRRMQAEKGKNAVAASEAGKDIIRYQTQISEIEAKLGGNAKNPEQPKEQSKISESPSAAVTPSVAQGAHNAALQWANDHPDDPRAAEIKRRNGIK